MVFDRRFNAASPRYLGSASNAQQQNDGLRPPLQDYCFPLDPVLLNGVRQCPRCDGEPHVAESAGRGARTSGDEPHLAAVQPRPVAVLFYLGGAEAQALGVSSLPTRKSKSLTPRLDGSARFAMSTITPFIPPE